MKRLVLVISLIGLAACEPSHIKIKEVQGTCEQSTVMKSPMAGAYITMAKAHLNHYVWGDSDSIVGTTTITRTIYPAGCQKHLVAALKSLERVPTRDRSEILSQYARQAQLDHRNGIAYELNKHASNGMNLLH